jgi:hypothetical protein
VLPAGRWTRASRSGRSSSHDGVALLQAGAGSWQTRIRRPSTDECLRKLAALEAAIDLAEEGADAAHARQLRLVHLQPRPPVRGARAEVRVFRNDAITVEEAEALAPAQLVISPGPGRPADAGVSVELIRRLGPRVPTLGVCLGHQAIVEAFGGEIGQARALLHGKSSPVEHDG